MKWNIRRSCSLFFVALCGVAVVFLHQFTVSQRSMRYIGWQSSVHILADGTEETAEFAGYAPPVEATGGSFYRFTAVLPEDLPEGYLIFETSGLDITLSLDETELYRSMLLLPEDMVAMGQAHVPLPIDAAGRTLTMLCRPLGGNGLFPPLLRHTDDALAEADIIAYANLAGIPAGAYGFAFVLVCGLFLLGVAWRKPDWSLIPLSLAAFGLMVHRITETYGYYFLPAWLNGAITWDGFALLIFLALAAYLLMNRRRDFWRFFGWATLMSGAALLIGYLFSLCRGGYLCGYINDEVTYLIRYGRFDGLLHWLTFWLVSVCALISAYALTTSVARTQADAKTLAARERLAMESYRQMERKLRETAALRHETNHLLTALEALYQKGDMEELGRALARFTKTCARKPGGFTANFAIDAMLQNAEAQAADAGIRFEAVALTPEHIPVPEDDLCGFVMNMLDNALEANRAVEDPARRFIRFRAELNGNFLVFRCENAYRGPLKIDAKGWPQTTKADEEAHGFGMRQMRKISEKYGSILDFSRTENTFTVQSALCIPERGAEA